MDFTPQFKENSLETCDKAIKAGALTDEEIAKHTLERIISNDLELAVDHPDDALNAPRVMLFWRANPLGSNVKGHEYFLKYLLGAKNSLLGDDGIKPQTINTKNDFLDKNGNQIGKLDLIVDADMRMNTTCIYSDIVLPSAHWYEQNDISSTDMHPFVHPFTAATEPAWEAKTNWEQIGRAHV